MKRKHQSSIALGIAASVLMLAAQGAMAQGSGDGPVYKPPVRGAPASRVGGGSRGVGTELPRVYVLAPADIGFTTKAKPDLFWFASDNTSAKITLTVYTEDPSKPLLEQSLPAVAAPGIQRIKLSEFGLELQPRTEYRWRVLLVDEAPNRPAARAVASGTIQRTNAWSKLQARLQNEGSDQLARAKVYAEEGLWYDALENIGQALDADKGNALARKNRAALAEQVGLTEVGQFEAGGK